MISTIRPEQIKVSTGTQDNDTVTTKGYVDENPSNAIWHLATTQVSLKTISNTISPVSPLHYTSNPTLTLNSHLVTKKYTDETLPRLPTQEVLPVGFPGQTAFTLASTPHSTGTFGLFLNGQLKNNPVDYTFTGTNLTWNDPEGLTLDTDDELIAWYDFISESSINNTLFITNVFVQQSNITGDSTLVQLFYDNVVTNRGNGYDVNTSIFTAPITGIYRFYWSTTLTMESSHVFLACGLLVGGGVGKTYELINPSPLLVSDEYIYSNVATLKLSIGTTVEVTLLVAGGPKTVKITAPSFFNGYLVTT